MRFQRIASLNDDPGLIEALAAVTGDTLGVPAYAASAASCVAVTTHEPNSCQIRPSLVFCEFGGAGRAGFVPPTNAARDMPTTPSSAPERSHDSSRGRIWRTSAGGCRSGTGRGNR